MTTTVTFTVPFCDGSPRVLLTTREVAAALGHAESEIRRLVTAHADDPAAKQLLKGRSGSGRSTRWHFRDVALAAESLRGREWPVKRKSKSAA